MKEVGTSSYVQKGGEMDKIHKQYFVKNQKSLDYKIFTIVYKRKENYIYSNVQKSVRIIGQHKRKDIKT